MYTGDVITRAVYVWLCDFGVGQYFPNIGQTITNSDLNTSHYLYIIFMCFIRWYNNRKYYTTTIDSYQESDSVIRRGLTWRTFMPNDVMAAILKVWRHIRRSTFTRRTILPIFIPIRFEMT